MTVTHVLTVLACHEHTQVSQTSHVANISKYHKTTCKGTWPSLYTSLIIPIQTCHGNSLQLVSTPIFRSFVQNFWPKPAHAQVLVVILNGKLCACAGLSQKFGQPDNRPENRCNLLFMTESTQKPVQRIKSISLARISYYQDNGCKGESRSTSSSSSKETPWIHISSFSVQRGRDATISYNGLTNWACP